MSKEYLDAAAARDLTARAISIQGEVAKKETQEILDKIRDAANQGKQGLVVYNFTSSHQPVITSRLQSLGFTVTPGYDQRDGDSWLSINW